MPPSTIPIVYEDRQLLICVKPAGILAEAAQGRGLPDLLQAQYRSGGKPDFIAGVHRLDRNVGGLMAVSYTHLTLPGSVCFREVFLFKFLWCFAKISIDRPENL